MSYAKGSGNKFTLKRTNRNIPVITQPLEVVQAISLSGCGDISRDTPENLYFHIFGAVPSQMKLFIYGEEFNESFYTELGQHLHPISGNTGNVSTGSTSHNHSISFTSGSTGLSVSPSSHRHTLLVNGLNGSDTGADGGSAGTTFVLDWPTGGGHAIEDTALSVSPSSHTHLISGNTNNVSLNTHGHALSLNTSNTGFTPAARTSGTARTYFNNLRISVDGVDQTATLLVQAGVASFGDGTSGHVIVTTGIEINLNPFISTAGQHKVEFSLLNGDGPSNGGKIRYNLYLLA